MKKVLILLLLIFSSMAVFSSDLIIDSKTQTFSDKEKKIKLDGGVKVKLDNLTVESDRADVTIRRNNKLDTATFYDKPYAYEVNENKKREVKANILKVSLINKVVRAEGEAQSIITEGNTPIVVINADTQEYDTQIEQMRANGSVIVHYQDMVAYGDKAIVDVSKKGDVKKMQLIGNAKINQKENKAYADRFVYTASNQEIVSIGNTYSKMIMDNGKQIEVWAQYQQYNKPANTILASNKVTIYYDDYKAYGPKVTVFPSKVTNKFNKIVFLGRAKIVEKNRSIDADKIIITMEPKNFTALGNVKTIITNIDDIKNDN